MVFPTRSLREIDREIERLQQKEKELMAIAKKKQPEELPLVDCYYCDKQTNILCQMEPFNRITIPVCRNCWKLINEMKHPTCPRGIRAFFAFRLTNSKQYPDYQENAKTRSIATLEDTKESNEFLSNLEFYNRLKVNKEV